MCFGNTGGSTGVNCVCVSARTLFGYLCLTPRTQSNTNVQHFVPVFKTSWKKSKLNFFGAGTTQQKQKVSTNENNKFYVQKIW